MWESESESVRGREYGSELLSSTEHGLKTDGFELRGCSWLLLLYKLLVPFFYFSLWLSLFCLNGCSEHQVFVEMSVSNLN